MLRFSEMPLKHRLTGIIMAVTLAAMFVVCLAVGLHQRSAFKEAQIRELSLLGTPVAERCRAALQGDSADSLDSILASLAPHNHILAAAVYDQDEGLLASYRAAECPPAIAWPPPRGPTASFESDRIALSIPLGDSNQLLGTLWLARDPAGLRSRTRELFTVIAAACLAAACLGVFLAAWLQRIISAPVLHLADITREVAFARDYSLRAKQKCSGELGRLISGFNEMLEQIQRRDAALQRAHNELEKRVAERTVELNNANAFLTGLLEENQETQQRLEAASEKAMAAAEAKSAFLASMSHEIRTPINGLLGFARLLGDTSLTRTQKEYVDIINSSGKGLLTIINDVLDFSKLEAGKLTMSIEPFNLRKVVGDVADLLAAQAAEKNITLAVSYPDNQPCMAYGDFGRVHQVLLNLAGNAVKFTERGHVLIETRLDEASGLLRCAVRDTGIGIKPEARKELFQRFVQADASTTRQFGGSGLGLAISRFLVEMMNGEIGVESVPGEGSTFWFTVPLSMTGAFCDERPAPRIPKELRLLIIEPRAVNRTVLQEQLQLWNVECVLVPDTIAALELLDPARSTERPWTAVMLPTRSAAERAPFRKILFGPAARGAKIALRREPFDSDALDAIPREMIHCKIAEPLGITERLARMLEIVSQTKRSTGETVFTHVSKVKGQEPTPADDERPRVLLAEDNDVNSKLAAKFLEMLACNADFAANGLEAIEAAANNRYDIILMDCHMPECDGYEATRRIRARESEQNARPTPIAALTANVMSEGRDECIASGMDDFLAKPLELDALKSCIDRWTKGDSKPDAHAAATSGGAE